MNLTILTIADVERLIVSFGALLKLDHQRPAKSVLKQIGLLPRRGPLGAEHPLGLTNDNHLFIGQTTVKVLDETAVAAVQTVGDPEHPAEDADAMLVGRIEIAVILVSFPGQGLSMITGDQGDDPPFPPVEP